MLICPSITQILGHIYSIVEADLYTIHEEMLTLVELHRIQKKCSVKWFWFSPYAFVSVSRGCFHLCLCSKSLYISSPLGCTFFTMQITYCTHPKGIKMSQRLLEAKKIQRPRRDSNPRSSNPKSDALSIGPRGQSREGNRCIMLSIGRKSNMYFCRYVCLKSKRNYKRFNFSKQP